MREIEIKRAVRTCIKCNKCIGTRREVCPMNEEFGLQPFSPPGIFYLADGILNGDVKMARETSVVPFSCTMCGACAKTCASFHLHLPFEYPTKLIEGIRGTFVESQKVPDMIAQTFRNVSATKNAWRLPKSQRVEWEKKCEVPIPNYTKERNEYLLFLGDAPLIPETEHIPAVIARLLHKGGVNFGTLKEEEVDSGNEIREMGEEGLFEAIVEENIAAFKRLGVKKVITISPHDYHAFRSDYPKLGIDFEGVYHYTQVVDDLIRKEKIRLVTDITETVTFQDPCHLGRYNHVYEPPRDIIKALPGIDFVEMSRNLDESFCCGGGGGRMWHDDPAPHRKLRISDIRVRHAKEVGAQVIATACPYCLSMLKAAGNLDGISIKDIAELVLQSSD